MSTVARLLTKRRLSMLLFIGLISIWATACQQDLLEPPRLATQTAQAITTPSAVPDLILADLQTVTPASPNVGQITVVPPSSSSETITLWVNETSDQHADALYGIIDSFTEQNDIQVELVMISSGILPELVNTAVVSDTLPDLIMHPVEFSSGWSERGILDVEATTQVLYKLGLNTFDQIALQMVQVADDDRRFTALPSDRSNMVIIYRSDWFSELELAPPNSYDNLISAAEKLYQPDQLIFGLVVPTDSAVVGTQQVFEFLAAANGCELIDRQGEVTLLHPACLDALDYYRRLINGYSPIGMQTDTSALSAYLAGRTGIVMSSADILPAIAGITEGSMPTCPACSRSGYLAENSKILTLFTGNGEYAQEIGFQTVTGLGITTKADTEAAKSFATFWFDHGYMDWIAVNPERKMPAREGNANDPTVYIDSWSNLPVRSAGPTLADLFGPSLLDALKTSGDSVERWGLLNGQGILVTRLYEELVFSPLLQEMLSGYFTSSQTILAMQEAVIELIPYYAPSEEPSATQAP